MRGLARHGLIVCGAIYHDHSPEFWREVTGEIPNYQLCLEWLRKSSEALSV